MPEWEPDGLSPLGDQREALILSRLQSRSKFFRKSRAGIQPGWRNFLAMFFLPVIDVRGGIVVRALAGRRSEYRPLVSTLTESADPVTVATAIRDRYGWSHL